MTPPQDSGESRTSRAKAIAQEKIRGSAAGARAAKRKVGENLETYPIAAMAGGLALGVMIGAMLPRTRQEEQLLGSVGEALNGRASSAALAARDAGQAKLDELGISTDAAGKQVGKLIDAVARVVETAGSAAVDAARR